MTEKSNVKRAYIIECAEKVFILKGYSSVTMKDIIQECHISRGGIYLYFNSVDEVFMEVIKIHNNKKLESIKIAAKENTNFESLLNEYFDMQKNRLLHMNNSLKRAMLEFFLSHKEKTPGQFFYEQFYNSKNMILTILQNYDCSEKDVADYADLIMLEIEGLETLALSSGISLTLLDTQFNLLKKILLERRKSNEKSN